MLPKVLPSKTILETYFAMKITFISPANTKYTFKNTKLLEIEF